MNNFLQVYTSMEGRISRKTWWLATIALIVVVLIIEFVILAPLGFGPVPNVAALSVGDGAAASSAMLDSIHRAGWVGLIVSIVFGYPVLAIGVKRRHDRGNSGLDVRIFYGVTILLNLVQALGLGTTMTDIGNGLTIPTPSLPFTVISFLVGIFAIYLLVVLGFLKGTTGGNQYGPDPLLAGAPAAA